MNIYRCAKCGKKVVSVDTLNKQEQGLLLCEECEKFEADLDNPEYHQDF